MALQSHEGRGVTSRRTVLTALAATGAGLAAVPGVPSPARAAATATTAAKCDATPGVMQLLKQSDLNFQALWALGGAGQSAAEVGEVLTAVNTINSQGADYQSFTDTFASWGRRLAEQAKRTEDRETRRWLSLRASQYYAQALFFVLGTSHHAHEERFYLAARANWDTFASLCRPAAEIASVPWRGTRMPVWFFRPDDSGRRRPTVILNNGSDGQNVDMWTYGVRAALENGYNAVVFDGPGQGQLLFVEQIPFSDRWETVIGALLDWLEGRPDVDTERIALTGLSMAGNLAPRAAAFDHRIAALVAMPGCVTPWLAFPDSVLKLIKATKEQTNAAWAATSPYLDKDPIARFNMLKRLECFSPEALRAARQGRLTADLWTPAQGIISLDIREVVSRITAPTLVLGYVCDAFYQGQAEQLFEMLRSPKDYVKPGFDEGAQLHCSPMAPQRHCEIVFDWLGDIFRR